MTVFCTLALRSMGCDAMDAPWPSTRTSSFTGWGWRVKRTLAAELTCTFASSTAGAKPAASTLTR
jgi:hypothetical protein